MSKPKAEDPLIALRLQIIDAIQKMEPEHEWITTEMVVKYLDLRYKVLYSLSKIGNNLRILRKLHVVEDKRRKGIRTWRTTGVEYAPDPPVRLLITFPKKVHEDIVKFSKRGAMSKNAFVVNMVTRGCKRLPAKDPEAAPPEENAPPAA